MKQLIVKLLKSTGMYVPVKRLKDDFAFNWREKLNFEKKLHIIYKDFVKEGDLCFDLGGAYGNRAKVFLDLGAKKVIIVEPTTYYQNKLKKKFKGNDKVVLLKVGVTDKEGKETLTIGSCPALSTFEKDEKKDLDNQEQMRNFEWTGTEEITMVSMNWLIEKYGLPDFCKIDIEGCEVKALSTLTYAIPKLSFEYHTHFKDKALKCIDYISKLGNYEFNYSMRESMVFELKEWCDTKKIKDEINKLEISSDFGDIYCKLKEKK